MQVPEPHAILKATPVQTQVIILQELLLHKRCERTRARDLRFLQQIRPGIEGFVVDIVDDVVEVDACEGGDDGAEVAGWDGEDLADEGLDVALGWRSREKVVS